MGCLGFPSLISIWGAVLETRASKVLESTSPTLPAGSFLPLPGSQGKSAVKFTL